MLTPSREIVSRLVKDGFMHRSTKGSHHKYAHPDGRIVIVPHPRRDIPQGTVRSIYRKAGWRAD